MNFLYSMHYYHNSCLVNFVVRSTPYLFGFYIIRLASTLQPIQSADHISCSMACKFSLLNLFDQTIQINHLKLFYCGYIYIYVKTVKFIFPISLFNADINFSYTIVWVIYYMFTFYLPCLLD